MKFDTPAGKNPIDQLKVVGKAPDRIDGRLKTTGKAPYAYERHDVIATRPMATSWAVAIAKGRIESMDVARAKAARRGASPLSGAENAGKLGKGIYNTAKLLGGPESRALASGNCVSSRAKLSSRHAPPRS